MGAGLSGVQRWSGQPQLRIKFDASLVNMAPHLQNCRKEEKNELILNLFSIKACFAILEIPCLRNYTFLKWLFSDNFEDAFLAKCQSLWNCSLVHDANCLLTHSSVRTHWVRIRGTLALPSIWRGHQWKPEVIGGIPLQQSFCNHFPGLSLFWRFKSLPSSTNP